MATKEQLAILIQEYGEDYPVKTFISNQPNPNGKTYVVEQTYSYSSILKKKVIITTKTIGHRDPVTNEILPNRPKRKNGEGRAPRKKKVTASRTRVGAMEILDKVGKSSRIDECVLNSTDKGTALKILSVARYMVMTDEAISNIDDFVLSHQLPYDFGLTRDICYNLIGEIGCDTTLEQNLFFYLSSLVEDSLILAFDTTIVSTYSTNNDFATPGYNKNKDNLESFKLITLYSVTKRIPIMFDINKSVVPDVKLLLNTIRKAETLGLKRPIFILDRGFMKQENIYNMNKHKIDFVGATTLTDSWVAKPLMQPYQEFSTLSEALDKLYIASVYNKIYAITIEQTLDFKRVYSKLGDEPNTFKVYLTYCKDKAKARAIEEELTDHLEEIKLALVINKEPYEKLSDELKNIAKRYLHITYDENENACIAYNNKAIEEELATAGVFCIASSFKKSEAELIQLYRSRGTIEESYRTNKSFLGGSRVHFNTKEKVRGVELCRMIALGYYSNLQVAINNVIKQCKQKASDNNLSETAKTKYGKLGNWLQERSLRAILRWFDGIEHLDIKSEYGQVRLTTEYVARDQLFLDMLYAELENPTYTNRITVDNLP